MRGPRLFGIAATTFIALTIACSVVYATRGLDRIPEDIKLHRLSETHGHFRQLLLSDSVTENATAGILFGDDVLEVMSNGWLRLAGQYLILRRALERNTIDSVDIFMVPDLLIGDVSDEQEGRVRYTYTDTLFPRLDERFELFLAGDWQALTRFVFFDIIVKSLKGKDRYLPPRTDVAIPAGMPASSGETSDLARKRIAVRKAQFFDFKITRQNAYLLQRINVLCHARQIACRIVIEPIPRSLRPVDLSQLRSLVPDLSIVDTNDFVDFPDSAFYDGQHLRKPDWVAYYRTVLSEKRLLTFKGQSTWDGKEIAFSTLNGASVFGVTSLHESEGWGGRWTDGPRAELFADIHTSYGRPELLLLAEALIRHGPQTVSISVNGIRICEQTVVTNGPVVISCALPSDLHGPTRIKIETSYASSPIEWGEPDNRLLGIGLRTILIRESKP